MSGMVHAMVGIYRRRAGQRSEFFVEVVALRKTGLENVVSVAWRGHAYNTISSYSLG